MACAGNWKPLQLHGALICALQMPSATDALFLPRPVIPLWQDLDAGRHTEIDMFSGALMRMGKELGIPTPYNEYTYHMIKAMEEKNDGLFDYDGTEEPTWAK